MKAGETFQRGFIAAAGAAAFAVVLGLILALLFPRAEDAAPAQAQGFGLAVGGCGRA